MSTCLPGGGCAYWRLSNIGSPQLCAQAQSIAETNTASHCIQRQSRISQLFPAYQYSIQLETLLKELVLYGVSFLNHHPEKHHIALGTSEPHKNSHLPFLLIAFWSESKKKQQQNRASDFLWVCQPVQLLIHSEQFFFLCVCEIFFRHHVRVFPFDLMYTPTHWDRKQ